MISRLKDLDRKIKIDINVRNEDRAASKKRTGEIQRVYQDRKFTQQLQELIEKAAYLHREIHRTTDGTDQKDDKTGKTIAMKVQNVEEEFEALTKQINTYFQPIKPNLFTTVHPPGRSGTHAP
jgi:seryl-tRNA synthetase